ncbi:hypothetical protein CR513_00116, partial [Mucuna pruriens]
MHYGVERHYLGRSRLRRHPFVDGIIETPLIVGWKNLMLDKYDSKTYLDEDINAYVTKYSTSWPQHLTLVVLMNLRQDEVESLCTFMERFSISSTLFNDNGIETKAILNSLCKKLPTSMDELRARVSGYI